jgi:hypothetical protein
LRAELRSFPEVFIADGSGLDRVARKLKVVWDERSVVLPGSLFVLYDLFRGVPRSLEFHEDAHGGEAPRLTAKLDLLPEGSLVLGDRLYCSLRLFGALEERGQFGLVRRKELQKIRRIELLHEEVRGREVTQDLLVLAGTGQGTEQRKLRLIRRKRGSKTIELLTNVLDPEALPADVALRLYRRRWQIERMFYDLKVVLNLRRFYGANANAVAMQVYAAAIVYVALRVAQGRIAARHGMPPEELSTRRLFPRVAAASYRLILCCRGYYATCEANPTVRLAEPDWSTMEFASTDLDALRPEPRNGKRRKRRYCLARARHVSLHRYVGRKPRR